MKYVKKMFSTFMVFLIAILIIGFGCSFNPSTNGEGGGGGGGSPDTTAPTVSFTIPVDLAVGVAINGNITATFSEAMNPVTITTTTFTLMQGTTPLPCTVTYVGYVATLNPTSDLAGNTAFAATITTGVKDLVGNALTANKTWSFTTGAVPDTTAPTVISTIPVDLTTDVAINGNIIATFSEAMDAPTITTATFTLMQGLIYVPCTVTYVGNIATLNPTSDLAVNTIYTATVTTGAMDLAGNALVTNKTWSFTTGIIHDITAPTVISIIPADLTINVTVSGNITATFSEAMDPATITTATFTLMQGTTPVPCAVTYLGNIATLNPTSNLSGYAVYTATVTTGSRDLAGNALAVDTSWYFTTGAVPDTTSPTVISTIPVDLSINAPIIGNITATFSEAMDTLTITTATFTLMQGITYVPCAVTYVGNIATLNPTSNLAPNTIYTATVTTGARDLAGNALAADKTWSFTSGAIPDTTAPTVISTIPADLTTSVIINDNVTATFSEAMDPLTITTTSFTLMQGTTLVPCAVTYAGNVATLNPTGDLSGNTIYTATVTTGAMDLAGNALVANKIWNFTTAAGPAPVMLGTAGNFAILSKTGISTTGATLITGDIGVSPYAASFITGFALSAPPTTFSTSLLVIGKVYAYDYDPPTPAYMTTAVSDMELAYTDASTRPMPDFINLGGGDISGLTLVPGLYKWDTGVLISTNVTLNGGPNDVWIFQISGSLTMTPSVSVHLTGGALPKNIFWQAVSVTLYTNAHLEGIALSQTAVALASGSIVNGRLLSQAAVTLNSSTITHPAP